MYLCLWMIAHMFGAEGSAMLSARASLVRLVVHRSSVCSCIARLPFVCRYSARASVVHRSSACSSAARLSALSLTRRWSAVDLSRVHRSSVSSSFCWSAAFLSLVYRCSVCSGRGRCSVCCSAVGPPAPLSVRPALVSHWSVTGLSARQSLLCH